MKTATRLFLLGSLAPAASVSAALLPDPSFFGQPNTTSQIWSGFTSLTTNAPTTVTNAAGIPNWFDTTNATDGAFLTGSHVYSFGGTLNLEADVPTPTGMSTTIVLQAEVIGNPLDVTQFVAKPLGSTAVTAFAANITETDVGGSGSGFGGGDFVYRVEWNNLPAAASYAITYTPGQSSSSQVSARVDTLTSVSTPEPASIALLGFGGLLLRRRRNAAK